MNIIQFEDIEAWQLARKLTNQVYSMVTVGPFARDFALRDQITKAAGSTMHNTAEGFDAGSAPEFIRFLRYAKRSCTEVQSQLYVAHDQSYIDDKQFTKTYDLANHTRNTIGAFINYLANHRTAQRTP
jgi:four helix bundle protein